MRFPLRFFIFFIFSLTAANSQFLESDDDPVSDSTSFGSSAERKEDSQESFLKNYVGIKETSSEEKLEKTTSKQQLSSLSLMAGYRDYQYRINSNGSDLTKFQSQAPYIGLNYSRTFLERHMIDLSLDRMAFSFENLPSTITPQIIEGTELKAQGSYLFRFGNDRGWGAGGSLRYLKRDVDESTPVQITDLTSFATGVILEKKVIFSEDFSFLGRINYVFFKKVTENPTSGEFDSSTDYSVLLKARYKVSKSSTIVLQGIAELIENKYIGTGSRGVVTSPTIRHRQLGGAVGYEFSF